MTKKYVCSPKTGRVIEVGGSTYKKVSKNAKFKNKLKRSPKSSSKKKLTPCKSPRRRRKSAKGKKRRGRPRGPVKCGNPKGWGAISPSGHERTVMLEKCGKKCFLGRDKTFPICAAGTCRRSPKGVSAACIRARQMSSPRARKVKGRSKAYYNRIAERALAMRNSRRYSANGGPGGAPLPAPPGPPAPAAPALPPLGPVTLQRDVAFGHGQDACPECGQRFARREHFDEHRRTAPHGQRRYHQPRVNPNIIAPWRLLHHITPPGSNQYEYYYSNANTGRLLGPLLPGQLNYTLSQIQGMERSLNRTEKRNEEKWYSGAYGN